MFNARQYLIELSAALALYAALLVGASLVERAIEPTGALKLALHLIPMIGAFAGAWAIMRALWRLDELQRRIQYDAIAIAFLGTALITFGWGFAESGGVPRLQAFAVWPIMCVLWVIGMFIAQRRYR